MQRRPGWAVTNCHAMSIYLHIGFMNRRGVYNSETFLYLVKKCLMQKKNNMQINQQVA